MSSRLKHWLIAEDGEDDFLLLKRACLRIQPPTQLYWVKTGLEAQAYLLGTGRFADRRLFPLPDLILSDVKMPGLDGFELLAWVKRQPSLGAIPFVLLSSSPLECDRDRAGELGADGYLVKQPNLGDLAEALLAI